MGPIRPGPSLRRVQSWSGGTRRNGAGPARSCRALTDRVQIEQPLSDGMVKMRGGEKPRRTSSQPPVKTFVLRLQTPSRVEKKGTGHHRQNAKGRSAQRTAGPPEPTQTPTSGTTACSWRENATRALQTQAHSAALDGTQAGFVGTGERVKRFQGREISINCLTPIISKQ